MIHHRLQLSAAVLGLAIVASAPAAAQSGLKAAPSPRANTVLSVTPPRVQGQPAPRPLKITIDYGVPNTRGREVAGALAADLGKVWRLGANEATSLVTEVDMVIGGVNVPKGSYSLFAETTKGAWKLIVSKKTGEWGTEYDPSMDLARIPLRERVLSEPAESLTIWLIPAAAGDRGELKFAWGTLEHSTTWGIR